MTGLSNGTSYTFTVTATNVSGTGSASTGSSPIVPSTVPDAPTGVVGRSGDSSATVSWTAPSNGGAVITSYRVISSPFVGTIDSSTVYGISSTNLPLYAMSNGFSSAASWSSQDQYVTYSFTTTGSYVGLGLLYAAGSGDASRTIEIDGVVWSANQVFPATRCLDLECYSTRTISPNLSAGAHTLKIWFDSSSGSSNYLNMNTLTVDTGYSCSTSATLCTVAGLTNGASYTFNVMATNARGDGALSRASAVVIPLTKPSPATDVVIRSVDDRSVTVSWTRAVSDGGAAVSYTVTSTPGGLSCVTVATSCAVEGLTNGVTYSFAVTASNVAGSSLASRPSTSAVPRGLPGAPTSVSATGALPSSSVVSWLAPVSVGGAAITAYTVTSSPSGFGCTSTRSLSCTVTGLANGTSYTFTVTATNAAGTGVASAASVAIVPSSVASAPTAVAATSGNGQSVVSWTAPESDGGAAITGYVVTSFPGALSCSTTTETSCAVSGLVNGTSYRFAVKASNASGSSSASVLSAAVVPAGVPDAVSSVSVGAAGGSATISWSVPNNRGSPITGYTVTVSDGDSETTDAVCETTTSPCDFTGLVSGTSYTFSVVVTNGVGSSAATVSAPVVAGSDATVPSAPSNVVGVSGDSTVTLSWFAPASTGGSPVTGYVVTNGDDAVVCETVELSCTIAGLTNGTAYSFTVVASNAIDSSEPSDPSVPVTPATVPAAPTGVSGTSFQNGSTTVSWSAPAGNGGASVTGYVVTVATAVVTSAGVVSAGPVAGDVVCTTAAISCVITGLTNGVTYTFTVTASNAAGTSAASVVSANVVPATVPDAPMNLVATPFAAGSVKVALTRPLFNGGAPVKGFGFVITVVGGTQSCTDDGFNPLTSCVIGGLSNGVTYTFTATASNAAGTSVASAESNPIVLSDPPGAPTNVVATANENRQSAISWTAPENTGGFAITGYLVTTSGSARTCTTAGETTCVISLLTNGTSYTFSVVAITDAGRSDIALSNSVVPATVPSKVATPTPTFGNGSITLNWTAPASNGGADITGYTVTDATAAAVVCTTAATSCTISGLTNGVAYSFKIVAINAAGTSVISNPSTATTPATTPGAPTNVTATSNANTQSVVSWTAPVDNGGASVTGYTVTATPGGATCPATTRTTCTVTGLVNGTNYTFTVTATNKAGTSNASNASNTATPSTVPTAPTGVAGTGAESTRSTITWTAPVSNGGTAINSYTVTASPGGATCVAKGATSCTVAGLTNGSSYTFTVTATNVSGTGSASTASSAVVPSTVPGAPTGVVATGAASSQSVVSWTAPVSTGGASISSYTVTPFVGTAAQASFSCGLSNPCTVTGLKNGIEYTFKVTATNVSGTSAASVASVSVVPSMVPGAPTGVVATGAASTQSVVSWTAPVSTGGAAISSYTVTSSPGSFTCTSATTSCTVTGLTNGSSYTFTVTATNVSGTGSASTASKSIVPSTVPGAPTGVVATGAASTQSVVSWTAPASYGGSAVIGYTVTPFVGTAAQASFSCGLSNPCTVTGLTNGIAYSLKVTATNVSGTGAASVASSPVVPSMVPGAPTGVVATGAASSQSVVSWTAPSSNGGAAISAYTVTASPGGASCVAKGATSCSVTGLTNGTPYTFTVTATNVSGTGAASSASVPVVPATVPGAPTGVAATSAENAQSLVSWTAPSNGGASITSFTVTSNPGSFTCTTSSTSCTVTGLTNGASYTFTVTATNVSGTGSASSASASATPSTVPGAPTGVSASGAENAQSVVSWVAPVSNGGAVISSYTVTASPGGAKCSTTGATSCTVTGLANGTSYRFSVTATNVAGTGGASTVSSAAIPSTVPGAPTGVAATSGANAQSVVSWTAPSNGGAAISSYTVTASAVYGISTTNLWDRSIVDGFLKVGWWTSHGQYVTYSFTTTGSYSSLGLLYAAGAGDSYRKVEIDGVVWAANLLFPGTGGCWSCWTTKVISPVLTPGSHTLKVWFDSGAGSSNHLDMRTLNLLNASSCTTASTSCTVTGLTNGTSYAFTVIASNVSGNSAASVASAAAVPATVPGIASISGVTYGDSSVTVSWTAPVDNGGSVITDYVVSSRPTASTCSSNGALSCTLTGLTNGTRYTFIVKAVNSMGTGAASAASVSVTPGTVPTAPLDVRATSLENASSTVSWSAPSSDGGYAIIRYLVIASDGHQCEAKGATTLSCVVNDLRNGSSYTFSVYAINLNGSSSAGVSAPASPATVPDAPTNVVGSSFSVSQSTVTWVGPTFDGGATITSYTVTSSPGNRICTVVRGQTDGVTQTTCVITGLSNGTQYTFSVTATNSIGTSQASVASASATPATVPGAPAGPATSLTPKATTTGSRTVVVEWSAPKSGDGGVPIQGYLVVSDPATDRCYASSSTATSCTFTWLANATSYKFRVMAFNVMGVSAGSLETAAVTPVSVPDAPTNVVGTSFELSKSTVSWSVPFDNGRPITKYTVTANPDGKTCTTTGATSCVVTGLDNGTSYSFVVTATNSNGTSEDSAAYFGALPATVPTAPIVGGTTFGDQSVNVSWAAPSSNGGAPITGYTVTSTPGSLTCSTTASNCTVTRLTNGTSYTFRIVAMNGAGSSLASSNSASTMPRAVPKQPTVVSATSGADAKSVVSWIGPANNGGEPITGYTATASPGLRTCTAGIPSLPGMRGAQCTITGLTNGVSYTFTVVATNAVGSGEASLPSNAAIPSRVPDAPSVKSVTTSQRAATIAWNPPAFDGGVPVTGYTVSTYLNARLQSGLSCTGTSGDRVCTIDGLTYGTAYTFNVSATNDRGTGASSSSSDAVTPISVPSAPRTVTARSNEASSSTVSWTAPEENRGSAITSYVVTADPGGRTCTTGAVTTCAFAGLLNGTSYRFTVTAVNAAGSGAVSAFSNWATPSGAPGAPAVTSVSAGTATATVTVGAPANTGGAPITGYSVVSDPDNKSCTITVPAVSCTFTGLTNGIAYTFKATAANISGTGSASASSAAVTPAGTPDAPTDLVVTAGNTAVTVSWTAPSNNRGSAILGYLVKSSPGDMACTPTTSTGTNSTKCTVAGLTNGTSYTFTVQARNSFGLSSASTASPAVIPFGVPGTAAAPSVTAGDAAVTVTWVEPTNGGSAISKYKLYRCKGSTCSTIEINSANGITNSDTIGLNNCDFSARTCTFTGLTNDSEYVFSVAASNKSGYGVSSAYSPVAIPGVPIAADQVQAVSFNGAVQVKVRYTQADQSKGRTYTVTASSGATCNTVMNGLYGTCLFSGLTNGTSYTFSVTISNGAGGAVSSSVAATPATLPSAPTAVTGTSNLDGKVTVSWTAGSNGGSAITDYTVSDGDGHTCTATATSCSVTGLTNGFSYSFTVTATNAVGSSVASERSTLATPAKAPSAPVAKVQRKGATSAIVTWDNPAELGGSGVTSYTVKRSDGTVACASVAATSEPECTVDNLGSGSNYSFTVTATNSAGTSAASSTVSIDMSTGVSASTGFTSTYTASYNNDNRYFYFINSNYNFTVKWQGTTWPYSNLKYDIYAERNGQSILCSSYNWYCLFDNVSAGTYTVKVYRMNRNNSNSPWVSTLFSTTTGVVAYEKPSTPLSVSAVAGVGSAVVTWSAPSSNGGSPVEGYDVSSDPGSIQCSTTTTTCRVTGLSNDTSYSFTVTARNRLGRSSSSKSSNLITTAGLPGTPRSVTASGGAGSATVSWVAPSSNGRSAITGYWVTALPGGSLCTTLLLTCTFGGLAPGQSYTFTVRAVNAVGRGPSGGFPAAVPSIPVAVPGSPAILGLVAGNSEVAVSFTQPSNGNSPITKYTVTASPGGATCTNQADGLFKCSITGLTNGGSYSFTVTATNAVGTSSASADSASVKPSTVPGVPTDVSGVDKPGAVAVTWSAPSNNGGLSITSYIATAYSNGVSTAKVCSTSGILTCTITGLTIGQAYRFRVEAFNGRGASGNSAASAEIAIRNVPDAPKITSLDAGVGSVKVSWTAPAFDGGSVITGYTVTSSNNKNCSASGTERSCWVTGLLSKSAYSFTVLATNVVGDGAQSVSAAGATPLISAPSKPVFDKAFSTTTGSVKVKWLPANANGAEVSSYVLTSSDTTSGTAGQGCTTVLTQCELSGLVSGHSYTFSATATNVVGTSAAGTITMIAGLSFNPGAANGMFFIPAQLTFDEFVGNSTGSGSATTSLVMGFESSSAVDKTVTTNSSGVASVSWSAATLANGRAIVGYVVTVKSSSSLEYCVTTTLSCSVKNLSGSAGYTFTVTPFSGGLLPVMVRGVGLSWNVVSLPALAPEKRNVSGSIQISAPTGVRATPGFGSVTLSWMTPSDFIPGSSYLVVDSTNAFSCLTSGTACTVGGLTNGTAYSFTVRAVQVDDAAVGLNGSVTYKSGTASPAVPATPLNTIPKDSLQINTAYSVSGLAMSTSSAGIAYKFVGAIAVDTQAMQVLVEWTSGDSWTVTAISVPSAPVAVAISRSVAGDSTKAKIAWTQSTSTGGTEITGYTATLVSVGLDTPIVKTCTASGTRTSCTISDLPADVVFVASVVATNLVGDSPATTSNLPGVNLQDSAAPSAPRNVTGISGIGTITVSWTAPLSANGSTIISYSVNTEKVGSTDTTVHTCATTTGLSCTLTGLVNGIGYTVSVTATNATGTSRSANLTTANGKSATNIKAGFLSVPDPSEPGAITDLKVVSRTPVEGGIQSNKAMLTWTAAPDNGSEITGYVVTSSPDNLQCNTTKPSCVIANLVAGRNYTFKVVAYNRVGYSPSVTSSAITGGVLSDGVVAPPSSALSFFGADPVKVTGTVTASLSAGKVVLSGTLTSDKFTAKAGSLTLNDVEMVWRAAAQGTDEAGWSGTGILALGFGIKVTMKVSKYTDSGNWTLTANVTTGRPELLKGKLTLPEFSFGGTITATNSTVVWALSATMGQLNVIPGLLKLTNTALSVSNACPVLIGTTTQVCPTGNNGLYLSLAGNFTITIANKDYVSVAGYLVAGLNSRTVVLTVKFGDIDFGAGVVLTGPMLQVFQTTPGVDPTAVEVPISSVPSQPGVVQFTAVDALGESHVAWTAPTSNGGREITGYSVVATPVTKVEDTQTLLPVTCVVGESSVSVTTTPVKSGSDYATRNPTRKTMSVTSMNMFCDFSGLNYGTDYTYSVTAINANGPGVAAVSTTFKGVQLSVEGLDKAAQTIVMSGGLTLNSIGLSFQVDATVFPLGNDQKPLTSTNALAAGVTPMWGWAIAGTVSSEQAKNARTFIPASLAGSFAFTTNEAKATMNAETVTLPARTMFFGVNMVLSDGMKQVIKGVDSLNGYVWYSLDGGSWELKISLGTGWVTKINKVELTFLSTSITASGTGVKLDSFGIVENGAVKFPNNDGTTTTIKASLGVSLLNMSSIVFAITLSPGTPGTAVWPNIFGYKGFNLVTGSLSLGFDTVTQTPILGLMGTVSFPANITSLMGGTATVVVTLAGNMSAANPCMSIEVAAQDGVSNVVNIANGVIIASKFKLGLAPFGCTIGAGANAFTMPAGASISVAGSIMSVPISITMTVTIGEKATGEQDITVAGSATVGAFNLGQLKMNPSVLELKLTNKAGGLEHFKLSGGALLMGVSFVATAEADYQLGSTALNVKMAGSLTHANIGGIGFDDLSFNFALSTTSLSAFSVAFTARMTLAPGFTLAVAGAITPTQFMVTADADIAWGGLKYHATNTTLLSLNGSVPVVSTSTALSVNLWGTSFSGTMSVTNDANGFQSVNTFNIRLNIGGWNLGNATFTETVTMSGNNVLYRRRITEDLNLGVLHGRLDAEVAVGADGTTPVLLFNAYVGVTVDIGEFHTTGTLHVTDCGNPCVGYTRLLVEVAVTLSFAGRSLVSGYVAINVDFSFDIDFSTSFNTTSGIVYGCVKCTDPDSAGLLRWQSRFSGSRQISISSSRGVSFSASAKAKIQESASKSTCTSRDDWGTCWGWRYSWGSFVDKTDVGVSFDSSGNASVEWAGKKFNVDL